MKVKKRDGKVQGFDLNKPIHALERVYKNGLKREVPDGLIAKFSEAMRSYQENIAQNDEPVDIEKIQDFLRDFLIDQGEIDAAESFIIYRQERSDYREANTKLAKNVATKLFAKNVVNQNANLDENSFLGRIGEAASEVCKDYALKNSMSKMARKNHEQNMIYQHDLDKYCVGQHNCLTDPVDPLFEHGINLKQCDIRTAASLSTAFQLLAVNFQVQSLEQFGGISASHLDWTMVPYFRKSFFKHYKNVANTIPFMKWTVPNIDKDKIKHISVESELYKGHGLTKLLKKIIWKRALNLTFNELTQGVEGMIHNLNSLMSRSGSQLPFSSINYGTCTLFEGRAIIKALIEGTMQGTGKYHRTAIFPCCIFQYSKKIHGTKEHPGPNYDLFRLALKSTAHRIYPNYTNVDWSTNLHGNEFDRAQKSEALQRLLNSGDAGHKIYDDVAAWLEKNPDYQDYLSLSVLNNEHGNRIIKVEPAEKFTRYEVMSTMGCRTYNGYDINCDADYFVELFKWIAVHGKPADNMMLSSNQKDGRGNICPVTIIMPTLAMMAKESGSKDVVSTFMKLLDKKIFEARDMLIERFTLICSQNPKSAKFMWTNNTMVGYIPEEGPVSALKHGTLAIGQIGLAETLQILIGCDQTSKEGLDLGIRIEKLFNQRCGEFKKENKLNFGVYYTPAEGLCYSAMKKFKAKYGELKNISDHEYFTNSMHVPVYDDVDAFTKIDIESQMTGYSNAGCITYVELPSNAINNIDACEELVVYMMSKDIPYAALNFKLNTCRDCGYHGIDVHDECPVCGSHNIEHLARVTGYLSVDVSNMNYGKQKETKERVEHTSVKII